MTESHPTIVSSSFRDNAGFVWTDGTNIFRHVSEAHRAHYDMLVSSGLYGSLVTDGLMVPHVETDADSPRPGAYKVLKPEVVRTISYPYEWCFGQLRDAALLTLDVAERALDHGMSLRDASAYNVQFHRGRPVLIDTLSFETLEPKPWDAYRQFCQHFLAPLALMAYRDVRFGELSRLHIDGVPLDLASRLLPRRTKLVPGLQAHIHVQARLQRRQEASGEPPKRSSREMSVRALRGIVWSLRRAVSRLHWSAGRTAWNEYYTEAGHYEGRSHEHKRELVGEFIDAAGGETVWDLGGNIGVFSRIAAERGRDVVCFDIDPGCVEANYRRVLADEDQRVLPLISDLRNPAPGLGWANRERASLAERGPADVAMALALVHHLAIGNNVPLPMIASYFAELGRNLIIEFVPKDDEMVQRLLAIRTDIFDAYTVDGFERAFTERFTLARKEAIDDSKRVLYLFTR